MTVTGKFGAMRTEEALESLNYFGLNAEDEVLLKHIRKVLEPRLDRVIQAFYAHLAAFSATRALLTSEQLVARLQATQRAYLVSLGDFTQRDPPTVVRYFEDRARVGLAHRRVGLSLSLYIGAYARLGRLLIEAVAGDDEPALPLILTLHKVLNLDSHLAIVAYEQARYMEAVAESERDEVTGTLSRRALLRRLKAEFTRAKRFQHPFSVLFIDVDRFKSVNDEHGHDTGDKVLRAVAHCATAATRPEDIVGRYGGDEFLIGLVDADEVTASRISTRIREIVHARKVNGAHVNVSIGVACAHSELQVDDLIAAADRAMFVAKDEGRNRVRFALLQPPEGS